MLPLLFEVETTNFSSAWDSFFGISRFILTRFVVSIHSLFTSFVRFTLLVSIADKHRRALALFALFCGRLAQTYARLAKRDLVFSFRATLLSVASLGKDFKVECSLTISENSLICEENSIASYLWIKNDRHKTRSWKIFLRTHCLFWLIIDERQTHERKSKENKQRKKGI